MQTQQNDIKNKKFWIPLAVSLILLLGIGIGVLSQKYLNNTKPLDKFIFREDPIDEIISLINIEYVDSISKDSLYNDAVKGILENLDPHTVYIPASQLVQSNEILTGKGKGLGIEFFYINDTMLVTQVTNNSPAAKSGLKIGDKIIKVNNNIVSGRNLTNDETVQFFNVDTLHLTIQQSSNNTYVNKSIIKGFIKNNSVSYSTNLGSNQHIGYIKLDVFSATSYDDFTLSLDSLINRNNIDGLIIDLRDNTGGFLEESVAILDELIDSNKLLVYIDGKRDGRTDYKASNEGLFEKGKIIVLINEASASASEVVAGAIQDWDRGIIIGQQSYGKGLVQQQYNLSDGSAIRITTGKYYTPSGRSIQRSYAKGKSNYMQDYYKRLYGKDTTDIDNKGQVYYSKILRRPVWSNGGINPDIVINSNLRPHTPELQLMLDNVTFDQFINTFYFTQYRSSNKYDTFEEFNKSYNISDKDFSQLISYFKRENAMYAEKIFSNIDDIKYLKTLMKATIAKFEYGQDGYYKTLILQDNCISTAINILENNTYNLLLTNNQ